MLPSGAHRRCSKASPRRSDRERRPSGSTTKPFCGSVFARVEATSHRPSGKRSSSGNVTSGKGMKVARTFGCQRVEPRIPCPKVGPRFPSCGVTVDLRPSLILGVYVTVGEKNRQRSIRQNIIAVVKPTWRGLRKRHSIHVVLPSSLRLPLQHPKGRRLTSAFHPLQTFKSCNMINNCGRSVPYLGFSGAHRSSSRHQPADRIHRCDFISVCSPKRHFRDERLKHRSFGLEPTVHLKDWVAIYPF